MNTWTCAYCYDMVSVASGWGPYEMICEPCRKSGVRRRDLIQPFTAVAACPKCGHTAVHPWREPQKRPKDDSPVARMRRMISDQMEALYGSVSMFDADDSAVVRQCVCGHEWGQR